MEKQVCPQCINCLPSVYPHDFNPVGTIAGSRMFTVSIAGGLYWDRRSTL